MIGQPLVKTWLSLLLVVAIASGIFFRLVHLDRKIYWVDETFTSLWLSGYAKAEVVEQIYNRPPVSIAALSQYQQINPDKTFIDTIRQLEPQHPPLYYSLARLWSQQFGTSIADIRRFSAVVSLLAIPCLYFLALELFHSKTTALVAIALFSVSPFHLLYAQEARQYGLWTTTIVLSSWLLLRALRLQNRSSWCLYAASLAIGLYTSVNSVLLIIGYSLYVLLKESFRLNRRTIGAAVSCLAATIAYIPWLIKLNQMNFDTVSWTGQSFGLPLLAGKWAANGVRLFFDVFSFDGSTPIRQILWLAPAGIALLLLIEYAVYYLVKNTQKTVWLFVLTLIFTTFLCLAIPDLLSGGRRSGVSRYLIPSLIGVQLAVSFLLGSKIIRSTTSIKIRLWRAIFAGTIIAGIVSCAVISPAEVWWNKGSTYANNIVAIATTINSTPNQLIISDADVIPILSLSHRLDATAKIILPNQPSSLKEIENLTNFDNIYLFQPSLSLKSYIVQESDHLRLTPLYPPADPILWQIQQVH